MSVKKCIEKRDKAHLTFRVKMRIVEGWLENGAFEWIEGQIDSELSNLETTFEKVCDAHAELANTVKHNNPLEPDFGGENMDNFIMNCTDKFGELKARMLARRGKNPVIIKLATLTAAPEDHLLPSTVGVIEDGRTKKEDGENLGRSNDQDGHELKFAIQGKEGSFLTFIKRGDSYFCQNCKAPGKGSKTDRRKRARTEGIRESSIREHARDEHRLRVS